MQERREVRIPYMTSPPFYVALLGFLNCLDLLAFLIKISSFGYSPRCRACT